MIKVLFVCHGNICRSPMAEFLMRELARRAGLAGKLHVASAATSAEELGNPVYPPARRKLAEHGISCTGKTAVQMKRADYDRWDLILYMDRDNLRNILRITGGDPAGKLQPLLAKRDVADPWYTGDFETTWQDLCKGCSDWLVRLFPGIDPPLLP